MLSHVSECGAEVFVYVRLKHRVEVLKFDVPNQRDHKHLARKKD